MVIDIIIDKKGFDLASHFYSHVLIKAWLTLKTAVRTALGAFEGDPDGGPQDSMTAISSTTTVTSTVFTTLTFRVHTDMASTTHIFKFPS